MSDQYFSDKNYKDLNPAEKARLWQIRKKITGNDSNPSPPPPSINQVKRKISELKVALCDLERGVDPNDKHDLFGDADDNIKANASNSVLIRQTPSGKRLKNGGVWPLDLSITANAVINVNSQVEHFSAIWVNVLQTQVKFMSVTSNSKYSTLDLDSYADTCVLGANALVIQDHVRPVHFLS